MIILYFKQILFSLCTLFLVLLSLKCAQAVPSMSAIDQNVDFIIQEGKTFWEQRSDSSSILKAEHFINLAHEKRPNDINLSVLLAKIIYTRAYFFETENKKKNELFLNASIICKNAVLLDPDFSFIYNQSQGDSSFKIISALAEAPKSVVPGLFWWATNLGRYLNNKPVLDRLKQRELLEVIMHRILTVDPGFYYSGPYRFFGALYTRIPGIELTQSETYFDQALSANPEYLGNSVHMAEYYHQKAGNREQFNAILNQVINTDLTDYPELMSDNFLYQNKARALLKKETVLFD
tara:strand:+ start:6 stop:884 length:879 start_codon:yes stop_codon:yes gene_type:complete